VIKTVAIVALGGMVGVAIYLHYWGKKLGSS
jgi:hypothetical protein